MAKIRLRNALHIVVRGSNGVEGRYGKGKDTYDYSFPWDDFTQEQADQTAKRIWASLEGNKEHIVEGIHLPSDKVGEDGILDLTA